MIPRLRVVDLVKRFDRSLAIDHLSFDLDRGEALGLLGPNGAGKTTTFLCLAGLLRPDGGSIAVDGAPVVRGRGATIALIPETPDVYPMLSVWEHLAFVARSTRLGAGWQERASALLERFGLTSARDTLGQELSKGMRQKTLIAATVLADTPILLFDEPMIGLDPRGQRELRALIRSLVAGGSSVIISTHQIEAVESLCDRLVIMKDGRAVANAAIGDLREGAGDLRSLEDIFLEITA